MKITVIVIMWFICISYLTWAIFEAIAVRRRKMAGMYEARPPVVLALTGGLLCAILCVLETCTLLESESYTEWQVWKRLLFLMPFYVILYVLDSFRVIVDPKGNIISVRRLFFTKSYPLDEVITHYPDTTTVYYHGKKIIDIMTPPKVKIPEQFRWYLAQRDQRWVEELKRDKEQAAALSEKNETHKDTQ